MCVGYNNRRYAIAYVVRMLVTFKEIFSDFRDESVLGMI